MVVRVVHGAQTSCRRALEVMPVEERGSISRMDDASLQHAEKIAGGVVGGLCGAGGLCGGAAGDCGFAFWEGACGF